MPNFKEFIGAKYAPFHLKWKNPIVYYVKKGLKMEKVQESSSSVASGDVDGCRIEGITGLLR